jgi:plasmid maintenance system antidote protein VapI
MEVRGLKVADLAQATGISASTISSVRNENRNLSKEGVRRLASYFKVSAEAFMGTHSPIRKVAAKKTSRTNTRAVRFVQPTRKQGEKRAAKAEAMRVSKPTRSKG